MIKKIICLILICLIAISSFACSCNEEKKHVDDDPRQNEIVYKDEMFFENGSSDYVIVIPDSASDAVDNAAAEMQKYIFEAGGVRLPIVSDNSVTLNNDQVISIGKTSISELLRATKDYDYLGQNGFFIFTDDDDIIIDANTGRGVLYGVYDFLEKIIGVKFLTYDYTYIPKLSSLSAFELNIYQKPDIANGVYLSRYTMFDGEFCSHMRMNDEYVQMEDKWGGELDFYGESAHATLAYVPKETYFAEHPEWFYHSGDTFYDLCYSHVGINENGEVDQTQDVSPVKLIADGVYDIITDPENSKYTFFMLGQEDTYASNCCECETCKQQAKSYGRSGMVIRLINAVSDLIKQKLQANGIERDFKIVTFAYQWSIMPPWDYGNQKPLHDSVVPRDNVYIRIAPDRTNNFYSVIDEHQNDDIRRAFTYWPKVTNNFLIWTYNVNYSHYMAYYPTLQTFNENFKLYKSMNAHFVLLQAAYNEKALWQEKMNTYIASKLFWDVDMDAETVKREFIEYYYYGVSDYIERYIDNFDSVYSFINDDSYPMAERPFMWMHTAEIFNPKYWGVAFWTEQFKLLDDAITLINDSDYDDEWKKTMILRVKEVKLTAQYMVAIRYSDYYSSDDSLAKYTFLKDFFNNCSEVGLNMYCEGSSIPTLKYSLGYRDV